MLKYDSCYHMGRVGTPTASFNRFKAMSDALKATGRNILLNLCNWGEDLVHTVRGVDFAVNAFTQRGQEQELTFLTVGHVYLQLMAHYR